MATVARNAPCPCGSGLKAKKCCGAEPVKRTPVNLAPQPPRAEEEVPACDTYWVDARDSGAVHLIIGEGGEPLEVLQLTAEEADRLAADLQTGATFARTEPAGAEAVFPVIYAENLGLGVTPDDDGELEEPSDLREVARVLGEVLELPVTHAELRVELPAEDPRVADLRTVVRVMDSDLVEDVAMGFAPALFYELVNELDTPETRARLFRRVSELQAAGEISADAAASILEDHDASAHHEVEGSGLFLLEASVLAALSSSGTPAR